MLPIKRLTLLLVLVSLCAGGYLALRAGYHEYHDVFHPNRNPDIRIPPEFQDLDLRVARLQAQSQPSLTAYYRKPEHGAVIVLLHGCQGDRTQLLTEARIFIKQGYGILSLDLPGHGSSGGGTAWNDTEQKAVRRALDWLQIQSGEETWTFGLFGFSMGSWSTLMAATQDSRISAIALTGAYGDYGQMIEYSAGKRAFLEAWPMTIVDFFAGLHYWNYRSLDLVQKLKVPLLVIAGDQDTVVPLRMSQALFDAAPGPKQFLRVEGAGHGDYGKVQSKTYSQTLLKFFDAALKIQERTAHQAQSPVSLR